MGFEEMLLDGSAGVQIPFPQHLHLLAGGPGWTQIADEEQAVVWHCSHSPFRLDLGGSDESGLRAEAEPAARRLFEEVWHERRTGDAGAEGPRTADASWSPIVELGCAFVDETRVLRVLHRMSYEPCHEQVAGRVLVPVKDGTVEIVAHAVDELTGTRESTLSMLRAEETRTLQHPGQAFFDDPAHDSRFPEHALSRARQALHWLLDAPTLRVTRPAHGQPPGLVPLRAAQCAIVPPPRYCELPAGLLGMPDSMVSFSRIDLCADRPEIFEVWHLAGASPGPRDTDGLRELAVQTCAGWAEEGAEEVSVDAHAVAGDGDFEEVECSVSFRVEGRSCLAIQRWLADAAGRVWRLGANIEPSPAAADQARSALAEARRSFRAMTPASSDK